MGPLVLIGKDLVLEGSTTKIEDKRVPGLYIYISFHILGKDQVWKFSLRFLRG